jgi:MerR HTH family regulatory protein
MKTYTIAEFAKMTGYKVKTLQSWDRKGYLTPGRTPSNRRAYTDADLARLRSYADRVQQLVAGLREPEDAVEIGKVRFTPSTCLGILRVELQGGHTKALWSVPEVQAALRYLHSWVAQESGQ